MVVLVSVFLFGTIAAISLNNDFGRLEVTKVSIPNGALTLSGLLYRPDYVSEATPAPGIVLAHGLSEAKQMMSGIALELARNGFVALAIDLLGHGNSDGKLSQGNEDHSLGVVAAVHYLQSLSYVDHRIGLAGHSLGGGAIRAAAVNCTSIYACVFIGGGLGSMVSEPEYGYLNTTFPKNLLIAIGKYDVLFNLTELKTEQLLPVFGTSDTVIPDAVYGNFSLSTARKLVIPSATHLFEPIDPLVVSEAVSWMTYSLKTGDVLAARVEIGSAYLLREFAIVTSLVAFVGIVLVMSLFLCGLLHLRVRDETTGEQYGALEGWKVFLAWSLLGLLLFLPMSFVGSQIPFPPMIFGGSIAWWMLATSLVGLLVLKLLAPRFSSVKLKIGSVLSESFNRRGLITAFVLFGFMFTVAGALQILFVTDLRILVPIFSILWPPIRILMLLAFLPFFIAFFFVEGLFLHRLRKRDQRTGVLFEIKDVLKVIMIKVGPFVALICLQYFPWVLLGFPLFPGMVGFLMEFLWLFVPFFALSTATSWWFYRSTLSLGLGVVFNALISAWVAAVVFPF